MRTISVLLAITLIFLGYSFRQIGNDSVSVKETISPDTTILPKTDSNYAVKLLIPGKFNIDDIKYDANTMPWYALLGNGVIFKVKKIQPEHTKVKDESGNEKWEVKGHDSLNTTIMISGVEMLEKEVIEMKLGNKTFKVGDRLELNYNGKKFVITAEGEEKKDKVTKKMYYVDYKLFIAPFKKETNRTLLVYHKRVDEIFPRIIFMGDLDNDKKPDLIMNNTVSAKENHITLFMTNNSPKGKMYKVMGMFNYYQ